MAKAIWSKARKSVLGSALGGTALAAALAGVSLGVGAAPAMAQQELASTGAAEAATNTADATLLALMDEFYAWTLKQYPTLASSVGEDAYDDQLGDYSLTAADRRVAEEKGFLKRLEAIDAAKLSPSRRADYAITRNLLTTDIEGNGFAQRVMAFTTYSSPWQAWAGLGDEMTFKTAEDYGQYLARLSQIPEASDTVLGITRRAVGGGYTLPCVTLGQIEGTIRGVVPEDVTQSRLYDPFRKDAPSGIGADEWAALQAKATTVIAEQVAPAYAKAADYMVSDYVPACRKEVGISAQPGGAAYYDYLVGMHTTTDLSADAIHQIGLDEVARIRAEMEEVAKEAGYDSRAAFVEKLRTDPKYYAKTPEELMEAASRMAKTIDGKMPPLFGKLPRLPYGLREIPAETAEGTTTAYYMPGSPANRRAGYYYVNTSLLDQRPLWELPALTLHEAVPGHHNQIALQQEMDIHPIRRDLAFFTAFVEGWGLYSERLGIEMGIYDTPEKNYGRLSYEMWRACRLVVDTGMHSKGWTKQQAVDFMTENTALSTANIDAEVNRYISWPGQALAYKMGELKIRELRAKAEKELGDAFSLAAFHDTVLENGAVPLDMLEAQVDEWIASQKPADG